MKTSLFTAYEYAAIALINLQNEIKYTINDIVKFLQKEKGYIEFNDDTSYPHYMDDVVGTDTIIAVRYNENDGILEFITEIQQINPADATNEWFEADAYGTWDYNELIYILKSIE